MAYLTRAEILEAQDYRKAEVKVPEWGGTVLVRSLSAYHVQKLGMVGAGGEGDVALRAVEQGTVQRIVAWSVIDGDGKRLFTEKDVKALGDKDFEPVQRIADAAMKISGLVQEEEEEPKNL